MPLPYNRAGGHCARARFLKRLRRSKALPWIGAAVLIAVAALCVLGLSTKGPPGRVGARARFWDGWWRFWDGNHQGKVPPCEGEVVGRECVRREEVGRVRYDPCNPPGKRVVRSEFRDMGRRVGVVSPGLGTLERHRFSCLVLPELLRELMQRRLGKTRRFDPGAMRFVYVSSRVVNAVRVLAFGPRFDSGIARLFEEMSATSGDYPMDYVVADWDPKVVTQFGGTTMSAERIPFPDGHFDAVLCIHTLQSVPELDKSLQEIKRVLAPGGFALLHSPVRISMANTLEDVHCITHTCRLRKFSSAYHVRRFGRDLGRKLERVFGAGNVGIGSMHGWLAANKAELLRIFDNPEFKKSFAEQYAIVRKRGGEKAARIWEELKFTNKIQWT